jgi:hypothetical protein
VDDYERYVKLIETGIEEPHVDFKAAMSWTNDDECKRFEMLKHIAAMCTLGGGVLIVGRNDADKRSGCLTHEQAATFDPTKVNAYARARLRPLPPIRIVPIEYRGDALIVLDVPGFAETPPCFQDASQCKDTNHRGERRHYSRGDVYTRTAASQTVRLSDPDDWRNIWSQIRQNVKNSVSFAETLTPEDSPDPYALEYQEEDQNFRLPWSVTTTTGIVDLSLRPARYQSDRIPRLKLKPTLEASRASLIGPSTSIPETMPYDTGVEFRNTSRGVLFFCNHPEWNRCESGLLRTSGLFVFRRILPEEYNEQKTIESNDRRLRLIGTAVDLTLAVTMLSRLASTIAQPDEEITFVVKIGGLANRRIEDDSLLYGARIPLMLSLGAPGHPSAESTIEVSKRLTVSALDDTKRELASDVYQELLWIFGIEPSTATISQWQAAFKDSGRVPERLPSAE